MFAVGDGIEFGVFERDGELAFGTVTFDGSVSASVELNLTTNKVNELFDPDTGEKITDPDIISAVGDLTVVVRSLEESSGNLLLVGAPSQSLVEVSTDAAKRSLWLIVPGVLIVAVAASWVLVGRALRPVDSITAQVKRISTDNLDERVPLPDGDDEIGRLATTMNDMLGRLEQGDERQRRFSADVSHELRSPLAALRAAAELIERSSDHRVGMAREVMLGADRIDGIISDLLLLANEESGVVTGLASVDLAGLVRSRLTDRSVELDLAAEAVVPGRPEQLERLVMNLVENALRHADRRVVVSVVEQDDDVCLTVEDDGSGIAIEDRAKVFQRFVRLDDARSRDDGGTGLGLALVDAIIRNHGGSISVESSPGLGGAQFAVTLPRRT